MNKKIILTNDAPSPIGPYNQAVLIDNTLYISGQIPLTPKMNLIENDLNNEVKQIMENLGAILNACLLYTSPSPRDRQKSRMPSSA